MPGTAHGQLQYLYLVCVLLQGHAKGTRQAKVRELERAGAGHEDVLWLKVPVHDAATVAGVQTLQDLVQVRLLQ